MSFKNFFIIDTENIFARCGSVRSTYSPAIWVTKELTILDLDKLNKSKSGCLSTFHFTAPARLHIDDIDIKASGANNFLYATRHNMDFWSGIVKYEHIPTIFSNCLKGKKSVIFVKGKDQYQHLRSLLGDTFECRILDLENFGCKKYTPNLGYENCMFYSWNMKHKFCTEAKACYYADYVIENSNEIMNAL